MYTKNRFLLFCSVQELLESERGVHHPQPAVRSSKQPTDSGDSDNVESDGSEGEEELPVLMEVAQKQEDKWDCESILRYSIIM